MTDEFAIRKAARELKGLYTHLDEMKHAAVTPPEVRTMQNTGGKPAMPGNWLWMQRGVDMAMRLQQVAFNAFGDMGKKIKDSDSGTLPLLELIALNAQPISELDWSSDFLDELEDQASQLSRWLYPTADSSRAREAARQTHKRFSAAEVAALASAATGLKIDRKQVTYWGRSATKGVDAEIGENGIATYCLGQVIDAAKQYRDERKKDG